jgi:glucokinase
MERVAIGVDVGGTTTKAALVDPSGTLHSRIEIPTEAGAGTKSVLTVIERLMGEAPDLNLQVVGVGVGAAGFIDVKDATVTFSPNVTYGDPHIGKVVREHVGLPVVVDNDANLAAWGEACFGGAKGVRDLALLTLGTGVGGGFVVDGRLIRGSTGAGAEVGHMVIDPDGPECPCGLRGCLEQFASGTAIARMAREALKEAPKSAILNFATSTETVSAIDVARAAHEYDETACEVLRQAGKFLAIGLSNVVNLFDPEVIVLSGSVVRAGEPYLGPTRDELSLRMQAQRRRAMRLDVSKLGTDAGILGAAALALGVGVD